MPSIFETFYIPFVPHLFIIFHWSVFTMAALKFRLDNSNIHYLGAGIYWLSFLIQFEMSLILCISEFWLKAGHLVFYVLRVWILFKISVLASLLWHHSIEWKGGCHIITVKWQCKSRFFTWPPLTSEDKGRGSPVGLYWHHSGHFWVLMSLTSLLSLYLLMFVL